MKNFVEYLNEAFGGDFGLENGTAIAGHEVSNHTTSSPSVYNQKTLAQINQQLAIVLNPENRTYAGSSILSPEVGFERIRKTLYNFAISLPPTLNLDQEEGEEVFAVEQFGNPYGPLPSGEFGTNREPLYLYVYYFLNEHGYYEFFAQVVNEEELVDLVHGEGEDEDEDEEA